MFKRTLFLLLTAIAASTTAMADVQNIIQANTGSWAGQLYYLDYQSGKRFGIPMQVDATLSADGATLVRNVTYTDPGTLVYAINLTTFDQDAGELVESFFRQGKGELFRYRVVKSEYNSQQDWTLVYQHSGTDDNRSALIRHTLTRVGDTLSSSKEVKFEEPDAEFILRNGTELKLASD